VAPAPVPPVGRGPPAVRLSPRRAGCSRGSIRGSRLDGDETTESVAHDANTYEFSRIRPKRRTSALRRCGRRRRDRREAGPRSAHEVRRPRSTCERGPWRLPSPRAEADLHQPGHPPGCSGWLCGSDPRSRPLREFNDRSSGRGRPCPKIFRDLPEGWQTPSG